jgi:hypothetical protein
MTSERALGEPASCLYETEVNLTGVRLPRPRLFA